MRSYKNELELRSDLRDDIQDFLERIDLQEMIEDYDDFEDLRDAILDNLQEEIFTLIDDYTIYHHTSATIIDVLNYYSWEDNELGLEVNNISQASFCALYDYIMNEGLIYDQVDDFLSVNSIESDWDELKGFE